jgi:quercetin dioxygenase-like cupin family protein
MAQVLRASDAQVVEANPNYFTGTVFQSILASGRHGVQVVRVTFAPKARTAWHTHPAGQTLHMESGTCLFQTWGEPAQSLSTGDTVAIPAGEKHWHGASPITVTTHLAIQPLKDGSAAEWLEYVSDEQYAAAQSTGQ